MPLTNENMSRVISQSQREPGMIAGLSVQGAAPQMSAPPPPNVAGASGNSSGGALPIPPIPPTAIPPSPAPPPMSLPHAPFPAPASASVPAPSMAPQPASTSSAAPTPPILKPDTPPQQSAQTPPPGQAPGPAQIAQAVIQGNGVPGTVGSGQPTAASALDARRQAMIGGDQQGAVIPTQSVADPNSADPLAAMRAHRAAIAQAQPPAQEPTTATSNIGNILIPLIAAGGATAASIGARGLLNPSSSPDRTPTPQGEREMFAPGSAANQKPSGIKPVQGPPTASSVASAIERGTPVPPAAPAKPSSESVDALRGVKPIGKEIQGPPMGPPPVQGPPTAANAGPPLPTSGNVPAKTITEGLHTPDPAIDPIGNILRPKIHTVRGVRPRL